MNRDLDLIRSQGEGNSSPNATRTAGNQGMLFIGRHNEISFPNRSSVWFMIHKSQFTKTMTWKRLFVYISRCFNIILHPFCAYSILSASVGSNPAARRAGSHEATTAINTNSSATDMKVVGSVGLTPTSIVVMT